MPNEIHICLGRHSINFERLDRFLKGETNSRDKISSIRLIEKDPNYHAGRFVYENKDASAKDFTRAEFTYFKDDDEVSLYITALEIRDTTDEIESEERMLNMI